MKNVQIDANGQLHCWKCGSMGFTEKRTFRAKTLGVASVGVGALLAKKKLRCQACGSYNDVGSAGRFKGETFAPPGSLSAPRTDSIGADDGFTYVPRPIDPIKVKGTMCSVTFDGVTITVKNLTSEVLPLENLRTMVLEGFGCWFGVVGATPPARSSAAFAAEPTAVLFRPKRRSEFEFLVTTIDAHRSSE